MVIVKLKYPSGFIFYNTITELKVFNLTGLESRKKELAARREASARKRHVAASLQQARDKLSTRSGNKPEFEYELLQMFVRNELSAALTIPLLAIIIAGVCCIWVSIYEVAFWLLCVLTTKGILLIFCNTFTKVPKDQVNVANWRMRLAAAEFFYGTCWAGIVFLDVSNSYQAQFFIFTSILVIIAIRMMFASTVIQIVYASTIPMTAAIVIKFALTHDPFFWALAGMLAGIHTYFSLLAQSINNNIMTMFSYRAEKDLLIAEIEEAKAFSDEARRQAEEANFAKSRFLATMSHELRTPLNAILGFSEVMKDEFFGGHLVPAYKEYSRHINESGKHLLNLINEILDLSRIEAGRYELNEEHLRISEIASECCRLLKMRAENKGLHIVEAYTDDQIQLWGDERAIRQVCLNLLSNAIKFTPPGGHVYVKVEPQTDGNLLLSIRDTGPGIPKEEIPTVMTNFGQGSLAHEIAEGGTGLGLPIVKGLIEMHNGAFDLQSELRKGTEAIAIFPATRVTQALPRLPVAGETAPGKTYRHTATMSSIKSDVTEDDKQLAELLAQRLSRLGRAQNLVRTPSNAGSQQKSLQELAYDSEEVPLLDFDSEDNQSTDIHHVPSSSVHIQNDLDNFARDLEDEMKAENEELSHKIQSSA